MKHETVTWYGCNVSDRFEVKLREAEVTKHSVFTNPKMYGIRREGMPWELISPRDSSYWRPSRADAIRVCLSNQQVWLDETRKQLARGEKVITALKAALEQELRDAVAGTQAPAAAVGGAQDRPEDQVV